jgi:hypothetical protein
MRAFLRNHCPVQRLSETRATVAELQKSADPDLLSTHTAAAARAEPETFSSVKPQENFLKEWM